MLYLSGNNIITILYMPCFLKSIFGAKILTLFPGNTAKNKPVIEGLVLLNDPETGEPLALLDGAKLTAVRTGAVGGDAVRYTTPENSKSVGTALFDLVVSELIYRSAREIKSGTVLD